MLPLNRNTEKFYLNLSFVPWIVLSSPSNTLEWLTIRLNTCNLTSRQHNFAKDTLYNRTHIGRFAWMDSTPYNIITVGCDRMWRRFLLRILTLCCCVRDIWHLDVLCMRRHQQNINQRANDNVGEQRLFSLMRWLAASLHYYNCSLFSSTNIFIFWVSFFSVCGWMCRRRHRLRRPPFPFDIKYIFISSEMAVIIIVVVVVTLTTHMCHWWRFAFLFVIVSSCGGRWRMQ